MKKILAVVFAAGFAAALTTGAADAIELAGKKAIGWYDQNAPIGGQYWLNEKVGIAAGIGFSKNDDGNDATDEKTAFAFTGAVPIYLAGSETVHFLFRPGFYYETNPPGLDSFIAIRADLAVEFFLSDHFSMVGGHGLEYTSASPAVGDSQTNIGSRAISASSVGFYYYLDN